MRRFLFFIFITPLVAGIIGTAAMATSQIISPQLHEGTLFAESEGLWIAFVGAASLFIPVGFAAAFVFHLLARRKGASLLTAFVLRMSLALVIVWTGYAGYGYLSGGTSRAIRFAMFGLILPPFGLVVAIAMWRIQRLFGIETA